MNKHETLTKSKIKKKTAWIVFFAEMTASDDAIVIKENK
jgi:hypothetical protein